MMMEANKLKRSRPPPSPSGQPGSSSLSSSAVSSYENDTSANSAGEIYENRTEEEEDMANCLILLARGGCGDDSPPPPPPPPPHQKPSSRKFLNETAAGGFLLYECKTCSRTFSSFQALGGHRASHKKPLRSILVEENKKLPSMLSQASDDPIKAGKVHECSICGSEFSSGQALGGHMRRHRAAAASSNNSQIVNVNGFVKPPDEDRPRKIPRLDLNLPAPEDDLIREGKFQFVPISGKDLVFSAPPWAPWVDCHY